MIYQDLGADGTMNIIIQLARAGFVDTGHMVEILNAALEE